MKIDAAGIEKVIPHRFDMRMIDEIREYNSEMGVGIKYIRDDEFWCAGHFPGNPIMPGVFQVEAMAQTACFVCFAGLGTTSEQNMGFFTTMDKIRFSKLVRPGDVLELHVTLIAKRMNFYKFHGVAKVGGEVVSEATFSAMMDTSKSE
jgi:3-hydroxyacyl-[acyl-carrier-protein] dehydratase